MNSRPLISLLIAAAGLAGSSQAAFADGAPAAPRRWEFQVNTGVLIPTAEQRELTHRANLTAAQLSYVVRPDFAVTAIVGWARGRNLGAVGEPRLDVYTYDLGAELRPALWRNTHAVTVSPFAGVGAGGRSYRDHSPEHGSSNNLSAYVSAGGEMGWRRLRLRLELRDYLTAFSPLGGTGANRNRNDVVAMIGLRYLKRLP